MYKCPICGDCVVTLQSLRRHIQTFHLTNGCPVCGMRVSNDELKKHLYEKHRELYDLLYGDARDRDIIENNKKFRARESDLKYRCPFCGRRFSTFFKLRQHALVTHKSNVCPVCKKAFDNIDVHLALISKEDERHRPYFLLLHHKGISRRNKQFKEFLEMGYGDYFLVRE